MRILTYVGYPDDELEKYRANSDANRWELAISGYWSEDSYHSGHIAYSVQKTSPSTWVMNGIERNAELDDITEEDIAEGRLNDDQIQAMWGMTLEEAQKQSYERIVAVWLDAPEELSSKDAAARMYEAVRKANGKIVDEPDEVGLLN
jgi:hypothetical protein